MEERERGKQKKKNTATMQDALGTPTHPVSGPHNRKSSLHNAAPAASALAAVPGCTARLLCPLPACALKPQAGVTHIKGGLQSHTLKILLGSYLTMYEL